MWIDIKDTKIPAVGLGTWTLRGAECTDNVLMALEIGYRHIDTARMYGNEQAIGLAIKKSSISREDIFITTKIWPDDLAYTDVKRCINDSLKNLNTHYIDLILIHWPSKCIALGETLKAFQEIKEAGKVRLIGVSNFNTQLMTEAVIGCKADLACNQVEYHPFLSQKKVLDLAEKYGMVLTAYMPLAKGRVVQHAVINEIAHNYGKTPAQVALRWLIQQGPIAVIPKAFNEKHCRENFEIFDFVLSEEAMASITSLTFINQRIGDYPLGPVWDDV